MKELVIEPWGPAMGDHLLFSPLPRLAKEQGYTRVYISSKSWYTKPHFKKYIWECNPYIDGFKDAPGTFPGKVRVGQHRELYLFGENMIDRIVRKYRLDDGKRWRTPEIYFPVAYDDQFKDATIFDPSFSFLSLEWGDCSHFKGLVKDWILKNGVTIDYQIVSSGFDNASIDGAGKFLECSDFERYCSIVKSAKTVYCMYSGSYVLAVALGKKPNVLYFGPATIPGPSKPDSPDPKAERGMWVAIRRHGARWAFFRFFEIAADLVNEWAARLLQGPHMFKEDTFIRL